MLQTVLPYQTTRLMQTFTWRPKSNAKSNAFQKLCSYLENNDEWQYSMAELLEHMDTYLDGQEGYTTKHLQSKLLHTMEIK